MYVLRFKEEDIFVKSYNELAIVVRDPIFAMKMYGRFQLYGEVPFAFDSHPIFIIKRTESEIMKFFNILRKKYTRRLLKSRLLDFVICGGEK